MFRELEGTELMKEYANEKGRLYRLDSPKLKNNYFIITSSTTRKILNSPEIIGYENYDRMCNPTKVALEYFKGRNLIGEANILTILRGGLNYPLEECCYRTGIPVNDMSFLSCERVFEGEQITGLDIKYKKLSIIHKGTLIIGDIIATGDTLIKCLRYVIDEYRQQGSSLRNIILFTIGGNLGISVTETLIGQIKEFWPDFEGFYLVYYEGIFSTYQEKGVTGINLPNVDFYWKDGIMAPEYRWQTLHDDDALFEKCIIYDGGARRYEIPEHYREVMEYWESLDEIADDVDFKAFIDEKLGYETPLDYENWLEVNHYRRLDGEDLRSLYYREIAFLEELKKRTLKETTTRRLKEFSEAVGRYKTTNKINSKEMDLFNE